jgi:hypothetical protein
MAGRVKGQADRTHPLPRALNVAGLMTVSTIADVRVLVTRHLPESTATSHIGAALPGH